ncbi:shikimate kinase [Candidatus Pelagibacter communis]|uniref:shikimate kinase n=1 Tax=Pelagibacter ubique TaxID=198252 RepID=UPI00094DC353|nr:shikimate kinase [Candidatus Pelagibacter ubique]
MKTKKKIVLLGMMGSGKSTIGAILSKKLNKSFVDIDKKIEIFQKKKIHQIFKDKGEVFFRELEQDFTLSFLEQKKDIVISIGGGAFLNEKIRKSIKDNSLSFWLDWDAETLVKRTINNKKRPLINGLNKSEIRKIIKERNKIYIKSDFRIFCENHKKNEIVDIIKNILEKNENSN